MAILLCLLLGSYNVEGVVWESQGQGPEYWTLAFLSTFSFFVCFVLEPHLVEPGVTSGSALRDHYYQGTICVPGFLNQYLPLARTLLPELCLQPLMIILCQGSL